MLMLAGRCVSCSGVCHRGTDKARARSKFAIQLFFSILLTALSPAVLFGLAATVPGTPGKAPLASTGTLPTGGTPPPAATPAASFTLKSTPATIRLQGGGLSQQITVTAVGSNGFKGSIAVKVTGLPKGVTATPASFTLAAGGKKMVELSAARTAPPSAVKLALNATSGALHQTASLSVAVTPAGTYASVNTLLFDFGDNLVNNKLIKNAVVVTNTGSNTLYLSPTLTGNASYSIVTVYSCGTQLAAGKSCDIVLRYAPTVPSYPNAQSATLHMNYTNAPGAQGAIAVTGVSAVMKPGVVTATANSQVALYTITLPFPGRMRVLFGSSAKAYTLRTWYQDTDVNQGQISVFVAGMRARSNYHMAASVEFNNGIQAMDVDHAFTTGDIPGALRFNVAVHTTAGATPQPGLELANPINGLLAFDLQGNPVWTYTTPEFLPDAVDGAKMLPNGDLLVAIGPLSQSELSGQPDPASMIKEIREINLAGDTVKEISIADLNAALTTATCNECNVSLLTFHHDITPLPNGHWLILGNTAMQLSATSKPPLTNLPAQTVLGDVIVDVDENLQPVWVWNEFNHLDPNRHPYMFPDWTHTNALVYSPDDGNILVSIRHQNWVLKVNYHDGSGNGDILWRLGEGGDFKLKGGVDPTDWPYAQHGPNFFSPNTSGVFSLGMLDNGDDRLFPASNKNCLPSTNLPVSCLYSSVPVFRIDETGKTATLTFHQIVPPAQYASWGGNAELLENGDVEYDLCGIQTNSIVKEVTMEASPKTVWTMESESVNLYRAFRIPSMYPGVQW